MWVDKEYIGMDGKPMEDGQEDYTHYVNKDSKPVEDTYKSYQERQDWSNNREQEPRSDYPRSY